jgi:hypothetical protein
MPKPLTFDDRVWRGRPSTVPEAKERYERDPEVQLVSYASVLYSKGDEPSKNELLHIREKLVERVPQSADDADVLATVLASLARNAGLHPSEQTRMRAASQKALEIGLCLAGTLYPGSPSAHTPLLLRLTAAQLMIQDGNHGHARNRLEYIAEWAATVEDRNQRARVYRKLGMLCRKVNRRRAGWYWGIRALLVPKIPVKVRLKSLVALAPPSVRKRLGIE